MRPSDFGSNVETQTESRLSRPNRCAREWQKQSTDDFGWNRFAKIGDRKCEACLVTNGTNPNWTFWITVGKGV